jgi:ABC-type branched-subunit amino acid transport system ATPase component
MSLNEYDHNQKISCQLFCYYPAFYRAGISIKLQSKDIDTELTVAKNLKKPNSINEDSASTVSTINPI